MALLPFVTSNNKMLRVKAEKITVFNTPELLRSIDDMRETMAKENGIGLAAPQVGKSLQLFVIDREYIRDIDKMEQKKKPSWKRLPLLRKNIPDVYINPRILESSREKTPMEEGCLSLPFLFGIVLRPRSVKIEAYDAEGKKRIIRAHGLLAKVFQHETDHLQGMLFIDKADPASLYRLSKKRIIAD